MALIPDPPVVRFLDISNTPGSNRTNPLDESTLVSLNIANARNLFLKATGDVLLSGENGNKPFPLPANEIVTLSGPFGLSAKIYVKADTGASGCRLHAFAWAPE